MGSSLSDSVIIVAVTELVAGPLLPCRWLATDISLRALNGTENMTFFKALAKPKTWFSM
jgi:hypothetical protein